MARLAPLAQPGPDGGQVVVTRFECRTLSRLLAVRLVHARLKRDVRRAAPGFLAVTAVTDWGRRTMLSISLWHSLDSIYAMGEVPAHVSASRLPARLGVRTTCGIFGLAGDWRRIMFGSAAATRSPLHPLDGDLPPPAPHPLSAFLERARRASRRAAAQD